MTGTWGAAPVLMWVVPDAHVPIRHGPETQGGDSQL